MLGDFAVFNAEQIIKGSGLAAQFALGNCQDKVSFTVQPVPFGDPHAHAGVRQRLQPGTEAA